MISKLTAAAALFLFTAAMCAPAADAPENLRPPKPDDTLLHHSRAKGFQIYFAAKNGEKLEWQVKPDAELFNEKGEKEGKHYAGPSWELNDGSKIVADKIQEAPHEAACPLLLLKVKSSEGKGALSHVKYVQRLNTSGGAKPAEAPAEGKEVKVEYTADYYFYGAPIVER
ncbi:MAG TPA: DUF3455 domain-containing protein [Planctomycetota bacterium]|nr:DUF3455 domain-containing protein [Planctomycetota bacterium]